MADDPLHRDDGGLARPTPPRGWRERLDGLADATGSSPGRLLVGGVAVVALAAGVLWSTRPPAPPPEAALPFATTAVAASSTSSTAPVELVVHVAGAVARPGVTRVAAGARVVDAVDAAGGLTTDADGSRVNLAAPVADGERVYIPAVGEPAPPVAAGQSSGPAPTSGPLDLNAATVEQLEELPGVGPATAAAILDHRDRIGGFTSVDQLLDVRGIGEAKLEQLRPLVTV